MEDAFILHLHSCQTHLTSILAREPSAIGGITGTMPNRCGDRRLSLGAVVPFGLCSAEQVSSVALDASRSGARSLTLLAARFGAGETDLTTFAPDCLSYADLPCACEHVLLSPAQGFWPSYDHLWHKPSIERFLSLQHLHFRSPTEIHFTGTHFWHSSSFGNLKNALDTPYFIALAYGEHFPEACMKEPECRLTQGLSSMLNWLVTLKQLKAFPEGNQVAAYIPYLEDLSHIRYVEAWRSTPWFVLLEKPHWSEAFLYLVQELEDVLDADMGFPLSDNAEDKFQRSVQRMGSDASDGLPSMIGMYFCVGDDVLSARWPSEAICHRQRRCFFQGGACSRLGKLQEQALGLRNDEDIALAIARLQQAAFEAPCFEHFARSMVIFGAAIRPLLPAGAWPWPSSSMPAESGKTQSIWRLCNQPDITHRRVGQAELHFFSADVILVGEELQVELLWTATSDDSCIMVGSNSERENDTYYSFLHTLPHSHLMHWECAFNMPQGIEFHSSSAAASTSLSGFTSISTCRVPPDTAAAKLLKWETRATAALELQLRAAWRPEPLRLCPRSRAVVRRVSACSSPLHHADRIHKLLPHAVEDWLNYHFAIGIEHFTVFDTDGSYKRFVQPFVEQGLVTYHERFPYQVSPKLGLAAEAKELRKQRHMLLEPHALELCIWENRQVSDWVVVIHSFEEYLHSRILAEKLQVSRLLIFARTSARPRKDPPL
ncbi:unnamed protein product [Durusdinium trenchii]|uniref:Uncharacterized protein n=1 Tax=Durusdinium trenchii TaxID=1381693 RepID=A0ABP0RHV2_9DINO